MRNPKLVLDNLTSKAKDKDYKFQRLYRNLYNPEFYYIAYEKVQKKEGSMTKGTDDKTVDGMSKERIENLIHKIKNESYQPNPTKRVYIPKKNGDKRPLGIPSTEDKMIQEIVRMILEAIYDPKFSDDSHGFRPNKSCHTALENTKVKFNGARWFVEGDIKGFFDNIDHHILIKLLKKTIDDQKFINLIWKFLRAGYIEDWKFNKTYSGTPQGGTVSPILANIYLHELDMYMEKYKSSFDMGKRKRENRAYKNLRYKATKLIEDYRDKWSNMSAEERAVAIKEVKTAKAKYQNIPSLDHMDENYKRIQYVRYADDFLIGIIGTKEDAWSVKAGITNFLTNELNLELSQEKTLITNTKNTARFLGYDITISRSNRIETKSNGVKSRTNYMKVHLIMPREVWVNKLLKLNALKINEGHKWESIHRRYLVNNDDLEIISKYNAEIRGLYNYYKLANNVSKLKEFGHIMKYSFLKTMGNKYKKSVKKMYEKYRVGNDLGVRYETKNGTKIRFFYNEGFKKYRGTVTRDINVDSMPNTAIYDSRGSLTDRLKAEKCEWCGLEGVPVEMHHVRKLKDLKGKARWEEMMITRQRKTLALCANGYGNNCHVKLHAGKLD